jgi:uncharacterized protein
MKFTEHREPGIYTVKRYEPGSVKVNDMTFTSSFYMTQTNFNDSWGCHSIDDFDQQMLDLLLEEKPEVIILGTGETQQFPDMALYAHCTSQGVGLEFMTNDAACRTYNVITTEDRDIVLALIMPR